jgi:hypothetical protein
MDAIHIKAQGFGTPIEAGQVLLQTQDFPAIDPQSLPSGIAPLDNGIKGTDSRQVPGQNAAVSRGRANVEEEMRVAWIVRIEPVEGWPARLGLVRGRGEQGVDGHTGAPSGSIRLR